MMGAPGEEANADLAMMNNETESMNFEETQRYVKRNTMDVSVESIKFVAGMKSENFKSAIGNYKQTNAWPASLPASDSVLEDIANYNNVFVVWNSHETHFLGTLFSLSGNDGTTSIMATVTDSLRQLGSPNEYFEPQEGSGNSLGYVSALVQSLWHCENKPTSQFDEEVQQQQDGKPANL